MPNPREENYKEHSESSERENLKDPLTHRVIGCALEVHRTLGPGLLESTYETCLVQELTQVGIVFRRQVALPIEYKTVLLDCGYRIDLLVEDSLIVELKSVDSLLKLHEAQLLTYMKLAEAPIGLLINFNVKLLKDGIRRLFL